MQKIVLISKTLARAFESIVSPTVHNKLQVLHDGADLGEAKLAHCKDVGYVGSFHEGRGIELILQLAVELPTTTFHLVGGQEDQIARLQGSKVPANVILYGHLPHSEIPKVYKKFSIALAPYQRTVRVAGGKGNTVDYMSPLKIFEYMSVQKAIICSDLPAIREIMSEQETVFVRADSVAEWKKAIMTLQDDTEKRQAFSVAGVTKLKKSYLWSSRSQRIMQFVQAKV